MGLARSISLTFIRQLKVKELCEFDRHPMRKPRCNNENCNLGELLMPPDRSIDGGDNRTKYLKNILNRVEKSISRCQTLKYL
jgi:hypothetical protein